MEAQTSTGGGPYVGRNVDTDGGDFVGRDKIFGAPPPTLAELYTELNRKVDMILELIQGDEVKDIRGMRPRIREIEQRIQWILVVLGVYSIPIIYYIARLIWP